MFWKLTSLSASSPVEALLDKESFTLEELLDEEEIIQECKALNNRLINFLRDKAQVEQLLRYVIEEPAEDADSKRAFKFPFIACEVFTCEIDVILRTLVEEEELMDLLFSFLEPNRSHSALLAGYFSKVVVSLMLRKTVPLMNYVQAHQCVFQKLVDLIGITSIMEVLVRLLGADDHINTNDVDVMRWLADTHLLEMIVDKLSPTCPPEVQANAAETLCALTQNTGSAIATKLSSASFVSRIFSHALEESPCKSGLVYSLCVCISLLDPRRSASSLLFHSMRGQYLSEAPIMANPETVNAMLPKLGDLLMHLNLSSNEKGLPTPYGELRPPLGKHRLKIVEFIAVLFKAGSETAREELVNSGTVKRVIDLLFEYPYNNALHHHVESIISSCLESHSDNIIDHLFKECDIIWKILQADKHQMLLVDSSLLTVPAAGKKAPRAGYLGHITLISNKIVQLGQSNGHIQKYVKEDGEWNEWVSTVLQDRNVLENVYRWACGRPTTLHDRTRDSDDDDLRDRDFDVADLANNLNQAFRPDLFGNMGSEEDNGAIDRNDEDVYFDDGSAEVVISSLRLGDDQGSLFTNSNWFTFRDERSDNAPVSTSLSDMMEEINLNETKDEGNSTSDDEVVVGVDEDLIGKKNHSDGACSCHESLMSGIVENNTVDKGELSSKPEASNTAGEVDSFQFRKLENEDQCGDRPLLDCAGWEDSSEPQVGGSSLIPFVDHVYPEPNSIEAIAPSISSCSSGESTLPNGTLTSVESGEASCASDVDLSAAAVPSLFEEDVEFVDVEQEGTEKAMEQALKEGIIGEAGPLKRDVTPNFSVEKSDDPGMQEFNDTNYWRVEQGVAVRE